MLLLLHTFLVACTVPEISELLVGVAPSKEQGSPAEAPIEEEDTEVSDTAEESSPSDTGAEERKSSAETTEEREFGDTD